MEKNKNYFQLKNVYFKINIIILYFFLIFILKDLKSKNSNYIFPNNIDCTLVNNKLKNRTQPFEYENELIFFTELISCKIPFSFIRFADGENSIMKGTNISSPDQWHWNPKNQKIQKSLIESSSICTNNNNFIGIPCQDWYGVSKSILSFSNCTSSKFMSYSILFTDKNYFIFKEWMQRYIKTSLPKRWKIILVANSIINRNIKWAYKFYPVPDHLVENWDNYSKSLLSKLSYHAKENNFIFFISAGPAANVIISYLIKINNNNN